ncbi:hypothetical protein ACWEXK_12405 [Staphylococcus xylosus]|uniref:hypothetical protein n=1 Tax=Staphylococcus xylosus TaxID=1288 RepID=UPI000D1DCF19|nr:hypothetical protein [Staphylococcus xylosus]PTI27790.1 hypothetical protein BU115_03330 [Staphylococcus xylosus]
MYQTNVRYRDLKNDEKATLKANGVTNNVFNQRIKRGWELYDAINLPNSFRTIDGEVRKSLVVDGVVFFIYPHHYYKMSAYKLDEYDLIKRIENGATLDEAVKSSRGCSIYDKSKEQREVEEKVRPTYAQLLFKQSCKQFLEAK